MVLEKFDEKTWAKILLTAELDDYEDFQLLKGYPDRKTFLLIETISKVVGIEVPALLELYGEYFLTYAIRMNFASMIRSLGDDLSTFIVNLDSLHNLLQLTYTEMVPPSFLGESGGPVMLVTYNSTRRGLYPIAVGLLRAVAAQIYNQVVEIVAKKTNTEFPEGTAYVEQVLLEIRVVSDSADSPSPLPSRSIEQESEGILAECAGPQPLLSNAQLTSLLPYHLVLDRQMRIVQCGRKLRQFNSGIRPGAAFGEAFSIANPLVGAEFAEILRFINSAFTLAFRRLHTLEQSKQVVPRTIFVKGALVGVGGYQLVKFSHARCATWPSRTSWCSWALCGWPTWTRCSRTASYMSDIPLFDVTRELITINQQQKADHTINQKLNEATAQLSKTTQALNAEKRKTDNLLYQMLPKRVAESLRNGERVDAEKFSMVTVLFSDIVGFTDICSGSPPEEVVSMLNSIFTKFDKHTEVNQVYKVETIGDAYMVVGGCPDRTEDHAQRVADQGLDMLASSRLVRAAGSYKDCSIRIRVGMHSGPVVTGVVGEKMPRFCLFGDTVNTASRMESHGCPGLVHMSEPSYLLVKDSHVTEPRGKIYVKGKGEMRTYFLLGRAGADCRVAMETAAEWKNVQTWDENKPSTSSAGANGDTSLASAAAEAAEIPTRTRICHLLELSELDDWEDFQMLKAYTDQVTNRLFEVIAKVIETELPVMLEQFGQYFFGYLVRMNFASMIRSLGDDLSTFIVNLDSLHNLLQLTYTEMVPPSFLAECGDSKITVTYSSTRTGLYPVAVGILKSVASQIYNKEVEISVRQVSSDFLEGTAYVEQVSLEIQILSDDSPSQSSLPSRSTEQESEGILAECAGPQPLLSNAQLTSLLPYHLVLDRQMRIVQCGRKLRQFNSGIRPGAAFGEAFSIANPLVGAEFAEILRFINSAFTLAFRRLDGPPGGNDDAAPKELRGAPCVRKQRGGVAAHFAIPWRPRAASAAVSRREFRWCRCPQRGPPPESPGGQMRHLAEPDLLVFLGSLRVANLDQMQQDSLFMSDIPLFDVTRELITINQQQKADHTINQKLNEATTQLFKMTLALEEERQKTDNLLYQMLPKRVAESLRNGERVDAEKFSMVTVLFSDIVGFTDICSGSSPEAVITMLNSIFTLFDQHTEVHQVYKVETIGDAYMVVGGCPDRMEDHAQRVADQGLDMLESSRLVRAPGGEDGIQIRVGMHSGPVVTGVVGEKMPRFCLFGDTVNTASRMESHGCPGLVHMSEPSYL
uniref:guanylate cyclase n=5 Tax=Macrostomum lignano TaxID=282301 RepID=A0A1I8GEI2_9PLAT